MSEQLDLFAEPEKNKLDSENIPKSSNNDRILYFDLETQKSADDVGGWGNIHDMKLAVGVVWDSVDQKHFSYLESEASQLVKKLCMADLVVGFNVKKFDYTVLQPYADFDLSEIVTFDMLDDIKSKLNHRLSLNHLAENTLNAKKSADGLVSLQWYKEGKIDKIIEYCKQDVEITRDLFLYGESHGYVKYSTRSGVAKDLKVDWKPSSLISSS
ncbi:MAG: DEAD/DEAH box helicase [Nitrospina sp.]|nr:DEAD/DEAH box helicase [Nitrospina sp.]